MTRGKDDELVTRAEVVALSDELSRRLAGADTPTVSAAVEARLPETLEAIRIADLGGTRVALTLEEDDLPAVEIPCAELIPLCGARCCTYAFALTTKELDEGVIRWDYGRPYIIRQRASDGFCVHNDPSTHGCEVHARRPVICRGYDCRRDRRVWIDYAKRIPRPLGIAVTYDDPAEPIDLRARMRARQQAVHLECRALDTTRGDEAAPLDPIE